MDKPCTYGWARSHNHLGFLTVSASAEDDGPLAGIVAESLLILSEERTTIAENQPVVVAGRSIWEISVEMTFTLSYESI